MRELSGRRSGARPSFSGSVAAFYPALIDVAGPETAN